MSQPPNFSFYNNSAVQYSPPVQFSSYDVQSFPPPQHNPYSNQYHYKTSTWSTYPPSPVQTSPHLQSRSQSPQLYGNLNNSYTSPRTQSSPLLNISPRTEPTLFMNTGSKTVPVPLEMNWVPRPQLSPLVSTSRPTFASNNTQNKDSTNKVQKSPNRSKIFLERAKKLGIVCSRSKSPDDKSQKKSFNGENEALEKKNELNSLYYHDTLVIDNESAENMDALFLSVARKLATDVICSAVIELNAEYGISIEVDDFLKSVDNLLDDIDYNNTFLDEEVITNLEPKKLEAESNLEKLSSVTSSQTSLLNPDTPEFKPINIDIMDSMYLPFQTIPISPEYLEHNTNYSNNNIHTESLMMSTRNQDFVDMKSYWEEMVEVETQTVVEMVEKATITEFLDSLVNRETQTVQVERHCHTTGVQTDLPVPLVTAVPPKVKSKNKKLQTDPEMFPVKSSDPNYRYMKMLEKEVYNLRSQMCLIEIQRELHELQSTKSRWTEFFIPRHGECNGLNEILDARLNWLQQCHINIQTQLESGIARLDTGVGLKKLPEPIIYIPTATGNQTFVPKTVMCPSQCVKFQQFSNQEISVSEKQQENKLISQSLLESEFSDDKYLFDKTTTSSSYGEIDPSKDYSVTHLKVENEESSESDASKEIHIPPTTDHQGPNELNNTGREFIGNDADIPETSKESIESQAVDQTSLMASTIESIQSSCTQNNANVTISLIDDPTLSEEQSHSKIPISSISIMNVTSTSEHSEINPCSASQVCCDESPLEHHKASKLNLSPSANLVVKEELTEIINEESTMDDTEDVQLENMRGQDTGEVDIDTHVLHNTKSTDQSQLSVKDIPLPKSNAEELLERKGTYLAKGETIVKENSPALYSVSKIRGLEKRIDHYLSESNSHCPEDPPNVIPENDSLYGNSLEASINTPQDNPLKQEIPSGLNRNLLKAVTTQLVNDYPNLLSNPDYLQKLADQQTLLLQSYLDQKPSPQTGASPQVLSPETSPHNMGSLQNNSVQTTQQSNCSLNPGGKSNFEFAKISPGSSRSNSPVQFLQPSSINQTMNSFPVGPVNPMTSTNFISQQNMFPHSQHIPLKPNGSYFPQVPISNSTLQQHYSVNAFQNQYRNRPVFVNVPAGPINAQNDSGLYSIRQQHPIVPQIQNVPQTVLSTATQQHSGPTCSNPAAPDPIQMKCSSANNMPPSSKLMNQGSTVNGCDGMKYLISPDRQPLKEQSPPLSIKSYLVQKDKVKLTKRKNLFNTDGATGEEDSQSIDTSSETLYNTSFSKPEIGNTLSNQQSSNDKKDTSGVNTFNVFQRSSSFVDHSGYMSDCNVGTKVKRNSQLGYLRHDNTGYMSDSGFKSIPKTSAAPGFQYEKTESNAVTTAALLSGTNGFQNSSIKAHGIPSLLSLSLNSDNVQRFPNPKDSSANTDKREAYKTFVQQPEILHTRSEKKPIDTDMKSRKRNKTTSEISKPSENIPLLMFQTNSGQDDWDMEADPYPTTFKFKTDSQKSLNFGANTSNLCTFDNQAVEPSPNSVSKTAKKAGLKSEAKVNTQFLGRLLKSTESSNERKNLKAIPQALAMTASKEEIDEEEVDEWQTVPKKIKKAKPEVVLPPPKPTGKKTKSKEDAAFTKLIELMTARIPNTNRNDAIYIIGEIRKKKGTLKGIPLKDIIEMGTIIMSSKDKHKIASAGKVPVETHLAKDVPPRFKRIMEQTLSELPKSYEEGDICVICCDELSAEKTKSLDCGHEFHIMCINEWVYKHERTCPTCRQIALFPEEFPTLGAG